VRASVEPIWYWTVRERPPYPQGKRWRLFRTDAW